MSLDHLNTIYRSFDIRGKYPEEITDDEVMKIGQALVQHLHVKKVAVGRDIRPSADSLFNALAAGLTSQGAEVVDLGLTTTPMTYFMGGSSDVDATVMITASHMPSDCNGLKITTDDAVPLTAEVIQEIRDIVGTHTFSAETTTGSVVTHALQEDWLQHFKSKHDLSGANLKIVIDPANMIGILDIPTFKAFEPDITVHTIYDEFDHTCPNHEANPIKHETLTDLGCEVRNLGANLGVAFDGDADRVGFVDEIGTPIPSDMIGALIARHVLKNNPGAAVVCDIRSSKALTDVIEKAGGTVHRERVGHTFIRHRMREENAILGIELSGHFFFKDAFFSEGGPLPAFIIMEVMKETGKKLSELVAEVKNYNHSGEINSTISRTPQEIYSDLEKKFSDAVISHTDGLLITYENWWCNVRPSANDPVMRLNLEADTKDLMEEKRDQILEIIRK